MGILVSPTFKESGSETAKSLGHNAVLVAPKRGLDVSMLESFGFSKETSHAHSKPELDKCQSKEMDGNVLLGQEHDGQQEESPVDPEDEDL